MVTGNQVSFVFFSFFSLKCLYRMHCKQSYILCISLFCLIAFGYSISSEVFYMYFRAFVHISKVMTCCCLKCEYDSNVTILLSM